MAHDIVTLEKPAPKDPYLEPELPFDKPRAKKKGPLNWPSDPDSVRASRILFQMLSYCRPAGSPAEAEFIERFIRPLGVEQDKYGNLWKVVLPADVHAEHGSAMTTGPTILWSTHTDSVHREDGRQRVVVRGRWARLARDEKASCLGADDASGVWLLRELILAGKPGLYVFHREEEHGGKGSKFFVQENRALLDGIEAAIAFDRKGKRSMITHQMGQRTCSDAFALSLAKALGMKHAPDPTGSYTDTAFYRHVVPECTNVSVGYEGAHTPAEEQDVYYLLKLRLALLTADLSELVIERDPTPPPPPPPKAKSQAGLLTQIRGGWMHPGPGSISDAEIRHLKAELAESGIQATDMPEACFQHDPQDWNGRGRSISGALLRAAYRSVAEIVQDYPAEVADYLEHLGIDADDLIDQVEQRLQEWAAR